MPETIFKDVEVVTLSEALRMAIDMEEDLERRANFIYLQEKLFKDSETFKINDEGIEE
jgi:hypothetical protein